MVKKIIIEVNTPLTVVKIVGNDLKVDLSAVDGSLKDFIPAGLSCPQIASLKKKEKKVKGIPLSLIKSV
jgi:hypothetical protein